jgi:predicted lipoprotein with Yx(FWY)xxD motif
MRRLSSLAIMAAVSLVVGCGGSDSGDEPTRASVSVDAKEKQLSDDASTVTVTNRNSPPGKQIKVVNSDYGPVIADGRGEAFYLFDKEKRRQSRCYGDCARVWPPVLTKGAPRAGNGIDTQLLGTTKRKNGKQQVTYKGHPLYYYVDDAPGTILCQDVSEFGGLWLVVKPSGNPVT